MTLMRRDLDGLEVLTEDECRRLLATATIGRSDQLAGLPVILPVSFVVDGDQIVVTTGRGSKLDAATRHAVVAFEVGDFDREHHTRWSVVVIGVARPGKLLPAMRLLGRSWYQVPPVGRS